MDLDEAIKHCEEKAKELREQSFREKMDIEDIAACEECAEEHEQLKEWLKDYKRLLEMSKGDLISRSDLKNKFISTISVGRLEFEDIINLIDNAPTVEDRYGEGYQEGYRDGYEKGLKDGEKPQGKWIYQPNHTHLDNVKKYFCPFCRVQVNYPSDTCNNCGADMRGGAE